MLFLTLFAADEPSCRTEAGTLSEMLSSLSPSEFGITEIGLGLAMLNITLSGPLSAPLTLDNLVQMGTALTAIGRGWNDLAGAIERASGGLRERRERTKMTSEVRSMDWRDSGLAKVLYYALWLFFMFWPRPHSITPWQNVAIDAVLIAVIVWMVWPVFKLATTPRA